MALWLVELDVMFIAFINFALITDGLRIV